MLQSAKHRMPVITKDVVKHNASKVVYSKRHVHGRLWPEIVRIVGMVFVLLCQQRGIGAFGKLALLINKGQYVQRLHRNQLQSFFVVNELYVLPADHLVVVFLLHSQTYAVTYSIFYLSNITNSSAMAETLRELGDFKKVRVNGATDNHSFEGFSQVSPL